MTKLRVFTGKKSKSEKTKKRQLMQREKEFCERWHALTDEIFSAAVDVWGAYSDNCWRELADASNLSYETVRRLGDRETRFPHLFTIYKMAKAVGGDVLVEVSRQGVKDAALNVKLYQEVA